MATLLNGGSAEVVDGRLVVTTLRKTDEEGRAVPVTDEVVKTVVELADVNYVGYTTPGQRSGSHGALVVNHKGGELLLRVTDEDALPLVAELRADTVHVYDTEEVVTEDE